MAAKFKMRTPDALSAMGGSGQTVSRSQFSQLTDAAVRDEMRAKNEVPELQYIPRDLLEPLACNDEVYGSPDGEELLATARDIAEVGIQEPLIVCKAAESGKYVILSGNRRFAASAIARETWPDRYREYRGGLPCIVQPAPENGRELRKRMIRNNLQREKTPYIRMREIAVYSRTVTEEQAQQGGDTNIREVICRDLGVSQSEVTRYLKISSSLIPPLLEAFSRQLLSTSVAHQLAGESAENQVYVAEQWPFDAPLTGAELQNLLAKKALAAYGGEKPAHRRKEPPRYQLTDVGAGLEALTRSCASLRELADRQMHLSGRSEQRILKKINGELEKLDDLRAELEALQEKAGE